MANKSTRRMAALIGTALTCFTTALLEIDVQADERTVTVCIDSRTVQESVMAQAIAGKINADIGVRVEWHQESKCPAGQDGVIHISFNTSVPANHYSSALAIALPYEGVHIQMFADWIRQSVTPKMEPVLLAQALAHEIAHILQGMDFHAKSGIMKARWDEDGYSLLFSNHRPFTPFDIGAQQNRQQPSVAIGALRTAAEQGDAKSQFKLAMAYLQGRAVRQDYAEAAKWMRKAASQGLAEAQHNLGKMYGEGKGVTQDYAKALQWYRKAAHQGLDEAQYNLAVMYFNGRGVTQDHEEALRWLRKAADQGLDEAQDSLAATYFYGRGVTQDYAEAAKWFRKAADQGLAKAQYNLGSMYYYGRGVTQDYVEALKWFQKAADQGNADAQANLGSMYFRGEGVIQDYIQAHLWVNLSAAGLEEKKREATGILRDEIAKKMTPQQIVEAQRLAREWHPKKAK